MESVQLVEKEDIRAPYVGFDGKNTTSLCCAINKLIPNRLEIQQFISRCECRFSFLDCRHSTLQCSIFVLLIVNLFVFEYAPPFLSSLFVTPGNTAGCIAVSFCLLY